MGLEKLGTKFLTAWAKTGEKSLLATRPVKVNISGLKFCTSELGSTSMQTSKRILNGNTSFEEVVTKPLKSSEIDVGNFIKSNLSKDFSTIEEREMKCLIENLTKDSNNDINIIKKRLNVVNAQQHTYIYSLLEKKDKNAGFILDNFDTISKQIFYNKNFTRLGPDNQELVKLISKDNLQDIIKHINTNNIEDFEKYVSKLLYDSKPHNIRLGDEVVNIDSSEIISLLSATQSPSYFRTGTSVPFNKSINKLTEITHRVNSDDICPYYKLAEGILVQKPELGQIAQTYKQYMAKRGNKDIETYINEFFNNLEKSRQLPKQIELRTVVPDENALMRQDKLLDIFLERVGIS